MKHLIKTLIVESIVLPLFGSCRGVPGTQDWKIKKAASAYIEMELKDGEHLHIGKIQRKNQRKVKGKECTYVEIKYTISSNKGNVPKTLYLLLSKDLNSIHSASEKYDSTN